MEVKVTYVAAACNHVPGAADWGNNGLICYAACNSVLIYNPHIGGGAITKILNKHTNRVNVVCWISGDGQEHEIVSGSADKTAIIWSLLDNEYHPYVLEGHEDIVSNVDALYKDSNKQRAVIVTASADSKIKVWEKLNGLVSLTQNIDLGYNIALTLRVVLLPNSTDVLIAYGTNQSAIKFYVERNDTFECGPTLTGHEDWVTGLDFTTYDGKFLLASSSQDNFVRIWKFIDTDQNLINQQLLETNLHNYSIVLDSILAGHDGWVYSVSWAKDKLLSASLDKSMIIWEFNEYASMWWEAERLGEVGGNTLGFYGGLFSKDAQYILAHGYHGAFHLWKLNEELFVWEPQVTVGGHFKEVTDICWDPLGQYLMSVSADQTTRIHAPWKKHDGEKKSTTWHEVGRPQIHGFDISCLAIIDHYRFASGAEEKIIRTFQASQTFLDNFQRICDVGVEDTSYIAPKGASVPCLGLSNKAVYQNDNADQALVKNKKNMYPDETSFTAITLTEPPTEENLIQNTLWPEVQKLYGHGYELYALASSPDGKFIASSCKATTPEHAAVIVWETSSWQLVQKLVSHTLTIAQLAFSPDSQHILSVSRDRRWSLFTKDKATGLFALTATTGKDKKLAVHTRIIWCCAWSHDSLYFVTGSRDGKVAVWTRGDDSIAASTSNPQGSYKPASPILELNKESITALAFSHEFISSDYLLAVGLENGFIHLYRWNSDGFANIAIMDQRIAHHLCVKRLSFRPRRPDEEDIQLASCSSDHSVRIYNLCQKLVQ